MSLNGMETDPKLIFKRIATSKVLPKNKNVVLYDVGVFNYAKIEFKKETNC